MIRPPRARDCRHFLPARTGRLHGAQRGGEAFPEEAKIFSIYQIERQLKSGRVIQEYLFGTRTKKGEIFDMDSSHRILCRTAGRFRAVPENRERDGFIYFSAAIRAGIDKVRRFWRRQIDSIRSRIRRIRGLASDLRSGRSRKASSWNARRSFI